MVPPSVAKFGGGAQNNISVPGHGVSPCALAKLTAGNSKSSRHFGVLVFSASPPKEKASVNWLPVMSYLENR
jgi:hypothetical protein